ncbi:MAG: hypothetical protein B6245_10205 [Desulfobacteraceae bacterium 4572_88]|nr:MAG: hypothetical protein B6245_10205 [Desulfobacteraceae bacterium 4572_88]
MTTAQIVEENAPETESQFFIVKTVQKATDTVNTLVRDYNEKYVKSVFEKGKSLGEGVKKDTRMVVDQFVEKGKKMIPEIPVLKTAEQKLTSGVKTLEGKISSSVNVITEKINLPSKKDIDKLTNAMEALNAKVETLNKKYSA